MERIISKKLIVEVVTNKATYRQEFPNYAELFRYVCDTFLCSSELAETSELIEHTDDQWLNR